MALVAGCQQIRRNNVRKKDENKAASVAKERQASIADALFFSFCFFQTCMYRSVVGLSEPTSRPNVKQHKESLQSHLEKVKTLEQITTMHSFLKIK